MPFSIEECLKLKGGDLEDLCVATEAAIAEGIGFNWNITPAREMLEKYWQGVMVMPQRDLFVARLDGTIAGAVQLVKHGRSKESKGFAAKIENHFVAPWARGHGIAKALLARAEDAAKAQGFEMVKLSVRSTQEAAINLYRASGYRQWGQIDKFEKINGQYVGGLYFYKEL